MSKIQNLKAIHNITMLLPMPVKLFLMSKIQNLKAIHNRYSITMYYASVVSDVKDTKFESNSQLNKDIPKSLSCCF